MSSWAPDSDPVAAMRRPKPHQHTHTTPNVPDRLCGCHRGYNSGTCQKQTTKHIYIYILVTYIYIYNTHTHMRGHLSHNDPWHNDLPLFFGQNLCGVPAALLLAAEPEPAEAKLLHRVDSKPNPQNPKPGQEPKAEKHFRTFDLWGHLGPLEKAFRGASKSGRTGT